MVVVVDAIEELVQVLDGDGLRLPSVAGVVGNGVVDLVLNGVAHNEAMHKGGSEIEKKSYWNIIRQRS